MILHIRGGTIVLVYDERADFAHRLGQVNISRASHVEPMQDGSWTADLSPVGGPILGPYNKRSQALSAEIGWLDKHLSDITRPLGR